jgi:4-amino-4-deoxy-L-arabinose transferase-like glycosyltransferase
MSRDWPAVCAWTVVAALATLLLALSGFASRDPDSTVYAGISARLATLPVRSWLAPEWWGFWGLEGPFREHPIGIFVVPALVARLGYPAEQAAYAVGAVCSIVAVLLMKRVASPFLSGSEAVAVQWAAMLLPIAFVYRIRANQEYPVLILLLLALYSTEQSRMRPKWIAGIVAAAIGLFLVKGIFVVFVPVVCGLWLILVRGADRNSTAWSGIAVSVAAVVVVAIAYEALYRRVAGDSFFSYYMEQRLGSNTGFDRTGGGIWYHTLANFMANLGWYGVRVIWFGIPGSLVLLATVARRGRRATHAQHLLRFCVAVAVVYVLAMSPAANRADRFVFPAYFAIGLAGAVVAMRRSPWVASAARWVERHEPYGTPMIWFALFMLTFLTASRLPYVQFSVATGTG